MALLFAGSMSFAADPAPAKPAHAAVSAKEPSALLDINTALKAEPASPPGIGDAYADRIIKGRPCTGKDPLKSRKIIPAAVYGRILGTIIAKQPARMERRTIGASPEDA